MNRRDMLLTLPALALLTIGGGCVGPSAWTRYAITPNAEWGDTHQSITSGNAAWRKQDLGNAEYRAFPVDWHVAVRGSGHKDEADRWWPDFRSLGEAVGKMDGMWDGKPTVQSPKEHKDGAAEWTRYELRWSARLGTYPTFEIGNRAWADKLEPKWQVGMLARCFPYRYHIQIVGEKRKDGLWVPVPRTDTCGHEIWHFPGLGGAFHPGMRTLKAGEKAEDFWVE